MDYHDLLTARPEHYAAAAAALTPTLHALTEAEQRFTHSVVTPLAAGQDWSGTAASHAHTTAQVHQHALRVTGEELAAAATALRLFAKDIGTLQTSLRTTTQAALDAHVPVSDDGSFTEDTTSIPNPGTPEPIPPHQLSDFYQACRTYGQERDAILTLATEMDAGCEAMLTTIAAATSDVVLAADNTVPHLGWSHDPKDLRQLELALNLTPKPNPESPADKTVERSYSALLLMMDSNTAAGLKAIQSVKNAERLLSQSPDPEIRTIAKRVLDSTRDGLKKLPTRSLELNAKALPVLDFYLNLATYSHDSHSTVEIVEKSAIASISAGLVTVLLQKAAVPICLAINPEDGEIAAPGCVGGLTFIATTFGGAGGQRLGDTANEYLFDHETGLPDPFVHEYDHTQ